MNIIILFVMVILPFTDELSDFYGLGVFARVLDSVDCSSLSFPTELLSLGQYNSTKFHQQLFPSISLLD